MPKHRYYILLIVAVLVPHATLTPFTESRSLWSNDIDVSREQKYERVPLIESKRNYDWRADKYKGEAPDSGTAQARHLEWFDSSSEDTQNADGEGFFDNVFWSDDKDDGETKADDNDLRKYYRKKYTKSHKILYPLLLAYKLKFFTMVPLLIGALTLLVGATGLAGFFFALFAAAAGIPAKHRH